jgi:hypothetical protein
MSDTVTLDLFLQDFIRTNKILGTTLPWSTLCSRRFVEDGAMKVFRFISGDTEWIAKGQLLHLPDAAWFRIDFTCDIPAVAEHRFDYLRMMHGATHAGLVIDARPDVVLVKLNTRHMGLINVVFVLRPAAPVTDQTLHPGRSDPFLV